MIAQAEMQALNVVAIAQAAELLLQIQMAGGGNSQSSSIKPEKSLKGPPLKGKPPIGSFPKAT